MLEVVVLYFFCKRMGKTMRAKNRKPLLFQFMVVGFWFGGEFLGAIVALLIAMLAMHIASDDVSNGALYGGAVGGGILGVLTAFVIAWLVPAAPMPVTSHGFPVQPPAAMSAEIKG